MDTKLKQILEFLISVKHFWKKIPEQIKRLVIITVILLFILVVVRSVLIPSDFGIYGHYRALAVDEIVTQKIHYAGQKACLECHDDIGEIKTAGYHKNLSCEVCHGAAVMHTEDPEIIPQAPRGRGYCPICHEYLPSRPTGFPQIVSASHNPMRACITCHNPHDPKPPEPPKECEACHAEIAATKSLSHHVYIPCVRCHEASEEHKIRPREFPAVKPLSREFCGQCHAADTAAEKGIPKIDLATHEPRYVCWQCHYPHLPEIQ